MKGRNARISALLICVVVWALTFPVIKFLLGYFQPVSLSLFRYGIGAVALFPFLLKDRKRMLRELRLVGFLFPVFALFTVPLPDLLQNFGMHMMGPGTAASVTSILQPMSPVFTLILAAIFLKEEVTSRKLAGISVAFAGAFMLSTGGSPSLNNPSTAGSALILLSSLSYAISGTMGKDILHRASPMGIMIWGYLFGSLILLPVWAVSPQVPSLDALALLALLFLSIGTLLPYLLWYRVLKDSEVSKQTAFVFLIPLFGVMFSSVLLSERIPPSLMAWGLLILLGVYLTQTEGRGADTRQRK